MHKSGTKCNKIVGKWCKTSMEHKNLWIRWRRITVPEAGQVLADAVEGAKPPDEARCDPLAGDRWGSRPELDSGRRRALPHGGHQLSWEFGDRCHGDGLTERLDGGDDGSGSGLCQRRHLGYPGSGPSTMEVKPLLPACFLLALQWLQCSSSCSSRGGRRRKI
jgi:hypothetical protein